MSPSMPARAPVSLSVGRGVDVERRELDEMEATLRGASHGDAPCPRRALLRRERQKSGYRSSRRRPKLGPRGKTPCSDLLEF